MLDKAHLDSHPSLRGQGNGRLRLFMSNTDKASMEEYPEEDDLMEEDSPPRRGSNAEDDDKDFPHYIRPRRADAEEVELQKKANTILIAPRILENVPLPMDIMPKIVKFTFEYFDT